MSLTAISTKVIAAKSLLPGSLAGVLSFVIGQSATQDYWFAGALSAAATMFVAWVASRPKMVSAQAAAQASAAAEWAKLLQQANELHAEQLKRLREKNDVERQIQQLLVNAKHNIAGALQASNFHIQNLHETMRAHNLAVPPFTLKTDKDLTKEEDKQILALLGISGLDR